jgi:hypothetical protein
MPRGVIHLSGTTCCPCLRVVQRRKCRRGWTLSPSNRESRKNPRPRPENGTALVSHLGSKWDTSRPPPPRRHLPLPRPRAARSRTADRPFAPQVQSQDGGHDDRAAARRPSPSGWPASSSPQDEKIGCSTVHGRTRPFRSACKTAPRPDAGQQLLKTGRSSTRRRNGRSHPDRQRRPSPSPGYVTLVSRTYTAAMMGPPSQRARECSI